MSDKKIVKAKKGREVGVDCGFGNVKVDTFIFKKDSEGKVVREEWMHIFPSRFKRLTSESTESIYLNGEAFSFIDGDLIVNNGHVSKENEDTRVLLWKALYDTYLETGDTAFNVCMNVALDSHKKDEGRSIKEKMLEIRTIKVKERFKKEVELTIENLECFPECLVGGATVTKEELNLREEEVIMMDIGTFNMQGIYVLNGSPKYNRSFATQFGMDYIYRSLANIVKVEEKGLSTPEAIQLYLEKTAKGIAKIIPKVDDIIMSYLIDETFAELDKEIDMIKPSLYCKMLLGGGGSITLRRFLDAKFIKDRDKVYLKKSVFANASGLLRKATKLFNAKESK